jgi:hypothetical protein
MSRDNLAKDRAKLVLTYARAKLTYARATLLRTQDLLQKARKLRSQEQKQTRAYRLSKELRLLKSLLLADPNCPVPAAGGADSGEASGPRRGKTLKVPPPREADPAGR